MAGVVMQRPNDLGRWYRCLVQQRGRQGQQAGYTDGEHRVACAAGAWQAANSSLIQHVTRDLHALFGDQRAPIHSQKRTRRVCVKCKKRTPFVGVSNVALL